MNPILFRLGDRVVGVERFPVVALGLYALWFFLLVIAWYGLKQTSSVSSFKKKHLYIGGFATFILLSVYVSHLSAVDGRMWYAKALAQGQKLEKDWPLHQEELTARSEELQSAYQAAVKVQANYATLVHEVASEEDLNKTAKNYAIALSKLHEAQMEFSIKEYSARDCSYQLQRVAYLLRENAGYVSPSIGQGKTDFEKYLELYQASDETVRGSVNVYRRFSLRGENRHIDAIEDAVAGLNNYPKHAEETEALIISTARSLLNYRIASKEGEK